MNVISLLKLGNELKISSQVSIQNNMNRCPQITFKAYLRLELHEFYPFESVAHGDRLIHSNMIWCSSVHF